eukprot:TRINITY_DN9959_c0_g1_i1.p1 TRINITY_DN9959_c0_g1~~TRINITY_DN9959_c0_g1_i1.p1  ORF type:complete len:428 (+),score=84.85 TRINITY_DN9959_c0_g1_i1:53-1336(+)
MYSNVAQNDNQSSSPELLSSWELSPRFQLDDPEGYRFLNENGFVVIADVLDNQQRLQGISLAWDHIEKVGRGKIRRNNLQTWDVPQWPNPLKNGVLCKDSVGQSEFCWFNRGLPKVHQVFSKIWGTENLEEDEYQREIVEEERNLAVDKAKNKHRQKNQKASVKKPNEAEEREEDKRRLEHEKKRCDEALAKDLRCKELIVSYDGFCVHRPFQFNPSWRTRAGNWFHFDQNGCIKPNRTCVQGLVNYFEAGPDDGGLVVVPGSHKIFREWYRRRKSDLERKGEFILVSDFEDPNSIWNNEIKREGLQPIKVCSRAGDLVLWDSRTIHCNAPAKITYSIPIEVPKDQDHSLLLRRLVCYVCMTPAKRLEEVEQRTGSDIFQQRRQAYRLGFTSTHWPEECRTREKEANPDYKPVKLSQHQRSLIPMVT